ncbi:MAG: diaminopimelate epimerase [Candidatus Promineifilaceae bacterium]|jgi:diaminopimelate epimerase
MKFSKYHALGNDYIVIDSQELDAEPDQHMIRTVCHRNYGIGSDGILLGPLESAMAGFGLRIFNSDGSEAEKSGNGLRIFARYLFDQDYVSDRPFTVETKGGAVSCDVSADGRMVKVDMGRVSFDSLEIPVAGPPREVLEETIFVEGEPFAFCAATVGNPHCIVLVEHPTAEMARRYGPAIELDGRFPNRTNVQFLTVLDRANIQIEIWERGAGYTLASGSSSVAAASVAHKLGLCDRDIQVHMPGGRLAIQIAPDFTVSQEGPVRKICDGVLAPELLQSEADGEGAAI